MDIAFNCDQCGQNIVIDEAGAGLVNGVPEMRLDTDRTPKVSQDSGNTFPSH